MADAPDGKERGREYVRNGNGVLVPVSFAGMSAQAFRWLISIIVALLLIGGGYMAGTVFENSRSIGILNERIHDIRLQEARENAALRQELTTSVSGLRELIIRCNNNTGPCQ